jgi:predicted transcriptional regulator
LQNAQQHQHIQTCKKIIHVVSRFHYPLPPMSKTTILKPLKLKEDLPFTKTICNNKQQHFFETLKDFKTNENTTFFEF